jgi:hypothetical protein
MDDKQKKTIERVQQYILQPPSLLKKNRDSRLKSNQSCECCGFPISERHHLLPFSSFGENALTLSLCPNCHSIYHSFEMHPLNDNDIAHMKLEYHGAEDIDKVYFASKLWLAMLWREIDSLKVEKNQSLRDVFG